MTKDPSGEWIDAAKKLIDGEAAELPCPDCGAELSGRYIESPGRVELHIWCNACGAEAYAPMTAGTQDF